MNPDVSVYVPAGLDELIALYRDLVGTDSARPVRQQLDRQAERLLAAHRRADRVSVIQISNWLPRLAGRPPAEILAADFTLDDARRTIAREHGFESWAEVVENGAATPDPLFERAVEAVVCGDIERLRALLDQDPALVTKRSSYGHGATLLHYVAANGVETRRQTVPSNAVEIVRLLIDRGADPSARMKVYGGEFDTLALATTSAHPPAAGVIDGMVEALRGA